MTTTDQITSVFDELRLGNTEAALDLLGSTWRGIGKRPHEASTHRKTAENLLLCGMLTSKLGAERRTKGAQEAAKDLLNEAFRLFSKIRDPRKYKAQIELALCYWRSGEINEAVAYITDLRPSDPELAFEATLIKVLLETQTGKVDQALATLKSIESAAEHMPLVLRGQFHQDRAATLRKIAGQENLDRALLDYQSALIYYSDAGCIKGEAMVRNNLASIYRDFGEYTRAHSNAARAISLFTRLNNQHLIAESEDQQASIFFAEGNYSEAARLSRLAALHLQDCDLKSMLGRTLVTLGRSLARLGRTEQAQEELESAAAIFEHTHDPIGQANVCLTMIEELPQTTPQALENLARAAHLTPSTHLAERFAHASLKVGIQMISDNCSTYNEVDESADQIKTQLISRVLAKHGGINTRGAIVRTAQELGITHTGLLWFLKQHEEMGHKKRPRTQLFAAAKQKKSA
jgi:tetratricopeptide (TPR) repeat protein